MQGNKHRRGAVSRYSHSFRTQVARDYIHGDLSYAQVAEKYGLRDRNVVKEWVKWHRKNSDIVDQSLPPMTESEKRELEALQQRIKELENQLADERLRSLALDTMIDVAEEQLSVKIRKKSGTKQSKN